MYDRRRSFSLGSNPKQDTCTTDVKEHLGWEGMSYILLYTKEEQILRDEKKLRAQVRTTPILYQRQILRALCATQTLRNTTFTHRTRKDKRGKAMQVKCHQCSSSACAFSPRRYRIFECELIRVKLSSECGQICPPFPHMIVCVFHPASRGSRIELS